MLQFARERMLPRICSWIPGSLWQMVTGVELVAPYYHMVSDHPVDHVSGLYRFRNIREFRDDVEFLARHYRPVDLQRVIRHIEGTERLPARCLFISFDDGFREVYEIVAPILAEVGVPAGVFVITSAVDNHLLCYTQKKSLLIRRLPKITSAIVRKTAADVLNRAGFSDVDMASAICAVDYRQRDVLDELGRILECDYDDYLRTVRPYLTSEQLLRLSAQGFAIGAHSIDHPFYRDLSIEEQLRQTEESARWLSQGFGYHCQSFAFPFEDAGICEEFFVRAFSNGEVKVVFGGVGMRTDVRFPRYIPRFSMEKTDLPAAQIVARAYCKASLWRFQHCFDRS